MLSFSARYSRAGTLGRETGVENKAWPTWGWQQILRVIFILILSKCKGNAWSCAFYPYVLMYTAHTIKCHHVFGWESLLLRGRKVWREGERRGGGRNTTSKSSLNCTILSKEKSELCKSWPGAHIWQWSDCFVSRHFPHSMQSWVHPEENDEPLKKSMGPGCQTNTLGARGALWSFDLPVQPGEMSYVFAARTSSGLYQPCAHSWVN